MSGGYIKEFMVNKVSKPKYLYNTNNKFIPFKTPIYYSGPYWDEKELESAVKALMNGKWLSSGRKCL